MTNQVTYVEDTRPVKQIRVANATGYLDLIVNKNNNGQAIRLSTRDGEHRVHVTLDAVDNLIAALNLIRKRGVQLSVNDIEFSA
jgi:hypothetical protein